MTITKSAKEKALRIYAEQGATPAAESVGVSIRTMQRWASVAGIKSGYTAVPSMECPSTASYIRGCRCDGCKEANRQTQIEVKERRIARFKAGEVDVKHGVSAYTNWDCRCEICRTHWSAYLRERRSGQRWDPKALVS